MRVRVPGGHGCGGASSAGAPCAGSAALGLRPRRAAAGRRDKARPTADTARDGRTRPGAGTTPLYLPILFIQHKHNESL